MRPNIKKYHDVENSNVDKSYFYVNKKSAYSHPLEVVCALIEIRLKIYDNNCRYNKSSQ